MTQKRRDFLRLTGGTAAAGLFPTATAGRSRGDEAVAAAGTTPAHKRPKPAEHCIMLWLGGGACQIDTWDPKRVGDSASKPKKSGSAYPAIDTAVAGVQVCEHLTRSAAMMERIVPVRTVHHDVIDEHAAAVNRMHTGRPTSGTIVYPSIGSVVTHQLGPQQERVPGYVLIGYPNVTRGPGFLGAKSGYVYLTDTDKGPAGLTRPSDVSDERWRRRQAMLRRLRNDYRAKNSESEFVANYDAAISQALDLSGPEFAKIFNLTGEADSLRNDYGGEFGQRCLLARRLIDNGVRFVEVSHNLNFINGTGWDTHNEGQANQHILIQELDHALATLITDLESRNMLDKTLIVVSTEFGRPAGFDGRGGRGHHGDSFTVVLAGGGLNTGQAIGTTDELGMKVLDRPVSVPDLHATCYAAMGINPAKELYAGERPVPITDHGNPIAELFG